MDIVNINVCQFQLHIEPRQLIILPPYKGATLRGGFGNAFKKVVCALKEKDCPDCILKERCVYSYVFETPPPDGAKVMRKYRSVPHPFIIEPPPERKMGYKPGDGLAFGLTLIGKAIDYLPYFIYTFDELGNIGIGKGRGKYTLKSVLQRKMNSPLTAHGHPSIIPSPLTGEGKGEGDPGIITKHPADENDARIYSSETKKLVSFTSETLSITPSPLTGEVPNSIPSPLN